MLKLLLSTTAATALLVGGAVAQTSGESETGAAEELQTEAEQLSQEAEDVADQAEELATEEAEGGSGETEAAGSETEQSGEGAAETAGSETEQDEGMSETAGSETEQGEGMSETAGAAGEEQDAGAVAIVAVDREGWGELEEGWTRVDPNTISAETIIGSDITNLENEKVATIGDVLLATEGEVENVVAEFGGFLGFGENTVLLNMDQLDFIKSGEDEIVIRTNLTPEELETMPEHEG